MNFKNVILYSYRVGYGARRFGRDLNSLKNDPQTPKIDVTP